MIAADWIDATERALALGHKLRLQDPDGKLYALCHQAVGKGPGGATWWLRDESDHTHIVPLDAP